MSVKMKEWCKDRHKENVGGTLHFCFDEFRSVNFRYGGGEREIERAMEEIVPESIGA